jgi:hypothetical protein
MSTKSQMTNFSSKLMGGSSRQASSKSFTALLSSPPSDAPSPALASEEEPGGA